MKLPEEWKLVTLGDINRRVSKSLNPKHYPDEVFEYYNIPAFQDTRKPTYEQGKRILSSKIIVESQTVLFGKLNPRVLKVWLVGPQNDFQKIASTEFLPIRSTEEADPEFIYYVCQSNIVVGEARQQVSGSTPSRQRVKPDSFYKILIPLPSLAEQRVIAHTLRTVQQTREARQRELALERERRGALMEHLFTLGIHGEILKQTDIGELPQSWRVVKLGELCADEQGLIQTGPFGSQLHASDYKESGIPVVNPTHLRINTIIEDHLPFISREDADRLAKHYLIEGDVLISRRGDFSRYSYITEAQAGWLCGTGCLLIRLKNLQVNNYFFSVWISSGTVQDYFEQNSTGSIMPNLNTKILKGMPVILPNSAEQELIAQVLRACDDKIAALEKESALLEELFRAMLEELMTGKLRIKDKR